MKDPVMLADGNSYERSAIANWMQNSMTSPISRMPIASATLVPNRALKASIEAWRKEHSYPQEPTYSIMLAKQNRDTNQTCDTSDEKVKTNKQEAEHKPNVGFRHGSMVQSDEFRSASSVIRHRLSVATSVSTSSSRVALATGNLIVLIQIHCCFRHSLLPPIR